MEEKFEIDRLTNGMDEMARRLEGKISKVHTHCKVSLPDKLS